MEILPSLLSQAVYGENGRAAVPLSVFMKQPNKGQVGGKTKIEHLGVPMIVALVNVNINMNKPGNHNIDQMTEYIPNEPEDFANIYEKDSTGYFGNSSLTPVNRVPNEFVPISDEMYDSLFTAVLDEPFNSEYLPKKKYTRKIIKHK
jgi:hypothetical protein